MTHSPVLDASSDSEYNRPKVEVVDSILGVFENLVPDNLVKAAYDMDMYLSFFSPFVSFLIFFLFLFPFFVSF